MGKKTNNRTNNMFNDDSILNGEFPIKNFKAYKSFYNRILKRILDMVFVIIAFLIIWTVYIIISIAIVLETGLPVLYRAERGGYKGKNFRIFKFRTMVQNADKIGGGTTALNDPRITKVGNFLRKTKLDETANLLNILRGEMSFIGPRPELVKYTEQYKGVEKLILQVRPGITDFSSIEFINLDEIVGSENADDNYEKYVLKKKNKLRLKYVATVSFKTDVEILIETIHKVIIKAKKFIIKDAK